MTKKLSQEFVADEFTKAGCELLEKEYKTSKTKMKYKCSCGNISLVNFHNFKHGNRCYKCKFNRMSDKKRLDENFIKKEFKKQGCKLLGKYKNSSIPVKYQCLCGRISKITWSNFRNGIRCKECDFKNKRTNFQVIKEYFKQKNCELLAEEKEYKNTMTKMKYKCECGNISKISWANFKKGRRCGCGYNRCRNLPIQPTKEDVELIKQKLLDKGCKLISQSKYGVKYECACGKITRISRSTFLAQNYIIKCRQCWEINQFSYIKNQFLKMGCELLETKYKNNHEKLKYRCECDNVSYISINSFRRGGRCSKCKSRKISIKLRKLTPEVAKLNNKLHKCYCGMIHRVLKETKKEKVEKSIKLLGYSAKELKKRFESFPEWNEMKSKQWSIDHIFPISAFLKRNIYDIKIINSLDNLQPMLLRDNILKSNNYDKQKFEIWLEKKQIQRYT